MAQYDRRLLVPYLLDVCSVEFAVQKVQNEISCCKNFLSGNQRFLNQRYSQEPERVYAAEEDGYVNLFWGFISLCHFGVAAIFKGTMLATLAIWLGIGWLVLMVFLFIYDCVEEDNKRKAVDRQNETIRQINKAKRARYEADVEDSKRAVAYLSNQLTELEARLTEAKRLREQVYSVNIIPRKYRNPECAYYLYDYFNSCRENDLDKIIQTMLLDNILRTMKKIVSQNEEIILNQRHQLAMQEKTNQALKNTRSQIARLERNQELQMDYQHMIAENQRVTNFFLLANWIEEHI